MSQVYANALGGVPHHVRVDEKRTSGAPRYYNVQVPVIRRSQMQVLAGSARENLIDNAILRINTTVPEVTSQMQPGEVEQSVHLAMRKGEGYGLTEWSDVMRYLDVMYILGFEFDHDPRYGWSREILTAVEVSGTAKMDRVTELALRESESAHRGGQE